MRVQTFTTPALLQRALAFITDPFPQYDTNPTVKIIRLDGTNGCRGWYYVVAELGKSKPAQDWAPHIQKKLDELQKFAELTIIEMLEIPKRFQR